MLYIVKYTGAFGFIKPWTAVRDKLTFTQQFLTPSIIEGMEKKLFPELLSSYGLSGIIQRHRLRYMGIDQQQEQTHPKGIAIKHNRRDNEIRFVRPRSIVTRGVMISPTLFLAFCNKEYAERAKKQHICLCRNEDILLPYGDIIECTEVEFDNPLNNFNGYELRFGKSDNSFLVGHNRYVQKDDKHEEMYGWLHIVGNPIYTDEHLYE